MYPKDYRYSKDHEWAKIDGNIATIGITHHAQSALGDVVFVDLPTVGKEVKKGDTFGAVESIKAVSDLYSPVTGKVKEIHSALADEPSLINQDPHGKAWMVKIEITDPASTDHLMDAAAYEAFAKSQ